MNSNSVSAIDYYGFCYQAFKNESREFNDVLFTAKNCSLSDSRDVDFNEVEKRLAYMYMHGSNVITLVEKCVLDYFGQCLEPAQKMFVEKTKICSLSNGPGIDIVGYLSALYKSKKNFACVPSFKAINLYESWKNIFEYIMSHAYVSLLPLENHIMLQTDIFSSFSKEAKSCIKDSDVLLMVNTFQSSKAIVAVVKATMQRIFAVLKPGSLVFYVGSKNNLTRVINVVSSSNLMDVMYGPLKVSPEKLDFKNAFVALIDIKPNQSKNSYFTVLQKKYDNSNRSNSCCNIEQMQAAENTKKKGKKRNKANENKSVAKSSQNTESSEKFKDEDSGENISVTSSSKGSDTSNESKNTLLKNIPEQIQAAETTKKKKKGRNKANKNKLATEPSQNTENFEDEDNGENISGTSSSKGSNSALSLSNSITSFISKKASVAEKVNMKSAQTDFNEKSKITVGNQNNVLGTSSKSPCKDSLNINVPNETCNVANQMQKNIVNDVDVHQEKDNKNDKIYTDTEFNNGLQKHHVSKSFEHLVDLYKLNKYIGIDNSQELENNIQATVLRDCEGQATIEKDKNKKELDIINEKKLENCVKIPNETLSKQDRSSLTEEYNNEESMTFQSMVQHCQTLVIAVKKLVENISKDINTPNCEPAVRCYRCKECYVDIKSESVCNNYQQSCCKNVPLHCRITQSHCTEKQLCCKNVHLLCKHVQSCCKNIQSDCRNTQSYYNGIQSHCRHVQLCCNNTQLLCRGVQKCNAQSHCRDLQSCCRSTQSHCLDMQSCCKNDQVNCRDIQFCCKNSHSHCRDTYSCENS